MISNELSNVKVLPAMTMQERIRMNCSTVGDVSRLPC